MAKQKDALDALIDVTMAEIMAAGEEKPKSAPSITHAPQVAEESFEQKQTRLAREAYLRRAEESHREREEIYRRNGLLKEGESLPVDEAALNARCCGK